MTISTKIRFEIPKDIIARRNQDGTVILMKIDESNLFYKITGLAARVWTEFEGRVTWAEVLSNYSASVHEPMAAMVRELMKKGLLAETGAGPDSSKARVARTAAEKAKDDPAKFGELKEFDLEEIETEVLNESIYLDVFAGSDLRLKKNVSPVEDALEKILQLEGVTYEWQGELPSALGRATTGTHAGLIAQQVASVMPELVRADQASGYLGVEYSKLASYFVEAIKDLNRLVTAQSDKIRSLEERLSRESETPAGS